MKIAILLAIFLLSAPLSAAYATESEDGGMDVSAYCEEQAELAGIEDANEKVEYLQECIDSFGLPAGDSQ